MGRSSSFLFAGIVSICSFTASVDEVRGETRMDEAAPRAEPGRSEETPVRLPEAQAHPATDLPAEAEDRPAKAPPLSPLERRARVTQAEIEAARDFAGNHYIFLTPKGRVDPSEGGIPPFAVNQRVWSLYRGHRRISEARLMELLKKPREARTIRVRKGAGVVLGGGALILGGASAAYLDDLSLVARGVGTFGGFLGAVAGGYVIQRNRFTIGQLYQDVQELNDAIRQDTRARWRVQYGVPIEEGLEN